jgi:hypothetical protein
MISFMEKLPQDIDKPESIIVIMHTGRNPADSYRSDRPDCLTFTTGFPRGLRDRVIRHRETLPWPRILEIVRQHGIRAVTDNERDLISDCLSPSKCCTRSDRPMTQISLVKG